MTIRSAALTTGHVLAIALTMACSQSEDVQELTFEADVRRVIIEVDAGSIDVRGSDWSGAAVLGEMDDGGSWPLDIATNLDGDTLRVTADCPSGKTCDAALRLEVPRDVEATVRAQAGSVRVHGVAGDIDIAIDRGAVNLVGVGGAAQVEVGEGSVSAMGQLRGSLWVTLETGTADLHFDEAPLEVSGDTVHGDVLITVPDGHYNVFADSVEGDVTVDVCSKSDAEQIIAARTTYGRVHIRH